MGRAELAAFAESRGGELLSAESNGMQESLRWRCGLKHEFEASPGILIHGGYWCPECFPSADDKKGWDWPRQAAVDPLVARFYRKA